MVLKSTRLPAQYEGGDPVRSTMFKENYLKGTGEPYNTLIYEIYIPTPRI